MIHRPDERDPVERLADEFASRCRRGETPSVAEYVAEYPQYARQIEELFPAVAMMEQFRTAESVQRRAAARQNSSAKPPEALADFQIIREIGRGGMGIVYEAQQQSLARRVAVKVLPKHVLLLDKHLKRFKREAQTAARLRHTNIVPVFGAGDHDGLHYYVMPLVRGVGLDEIIRELRKIGASSRGIKRVVRELIDGKFASMAGHNGEPGEDAPSAHNPSALPTDHWRAVAHVGVQAANALDHAHVQGTLHRDIKPGNLLVDADGVVCVADFGLARAVDQSDVSCTGDVVGTLRYMAPEQLRGAADARSDIYALGLTLYEFATLRPAFDDTDAKGRHNGGPARAEPMPPRKIDTAVPRDLETIVLKCLAPEPSRRYQTAGELATDLRRFLGDLPIRARRVSSAEHVWRWCRRNPALSAVSALAVLLLITVVATATSGYFRTREAYAKTTRALKQTEATSQLAIEALDDIYLQLSPDRIHVAPPSKSDGDSQLSYEQTPLQVQASNETARLLDNLLVFYDRLAEQIPSDSQVMFRSAIASRRVGDIRQRLGQADHAEREYERAVEKLNAFGAQPDAGVAVAIELARTHNEIGNVRSAQYEFRRAYDSHRLAYSVLQSVQDADRTGQAYRYELARTLYFLASKPLSGLGNRRGSDVGEKAAVAGPHHYQSNEHRQSAIRILEELTRENPDAPDYRLLLAICHRLSGLGLVPGRNWTGDEEWQRAVGLLKELTSQYPNVADYRYELSVTYAWVRVGLFPGEKRSEMTPQAESRLLQALAESQWLVTHNPTIPQYACSRVLVLAKLGAVYWKNGRLADAEDSFRQALDTQSTVTAEFPELPSHHRVLVEFLRLRLAQIRLEGDIDADDSRTMSRDLLETCIVNLIELRQQPALAQDRLARTALRDAYRALSHLHAESGDTEEAASARKQAEAMRRRASD